MVSYDENIRYFKTAGAVTGTFPTKANVDSATDTATAQGYSTSYWDNSTNNYPRLLAIVCLSATPTAASTVAILNSASSTVMTFAFAADAANKIIRFPRGGIKMPTGGFGVTTSADAHLFIFSNARAG